MAIKIQPAESVDMFEEIKAEEEGKGILRTEVANSPMFVHSYRSRQDMLGQMRSTSTKTFGDIFTTQSS